MLKTFKLVDETCFSFALWFIHISVSFTEHVIHSMVIRTRSQKFSYERLNNL